MRETAAKIYADELIPRGYGYPLWCPEGLPNTDIPRIGDVGYVSAGSFVRLLNVMEPKDSGMYEGGPPKDYEPLVYDEDQLYDARDGALPTCVVSSRGVKHFEVTGNIQG